jgi:hypothetical protein
MARREDELKRRQQKWLAKRGRHPRPSAPETPLTPILNAIKTPVPATWPGIADPSLARPDLVKFELAAFAFGRSSGKALAKQLERRLQQGLLDMLPELDHWAMEMFLYHGLPGDSWQPVDAFLEHAGHRFPPAAQEQLRLWKEARVGLFEIGPVQGDTVELREWDPVNDIPADNVFRAISLNIGGVNAYRDATGSILLTYLAPWAPADNLFCAMGYGKSPAKAHSGFLVPYLGLNHPDIVARPLPWHASPAAANEYLRRWQSREWHAWLAQRLQFPFSAVVITEGNKLEVRQVVDLIPSTPEQTRQFGVYFDVPRGWDEHLGAGATTVTPLDVTSPTAVALAEYRAYRERVGPPPGTVGLPEFVRGR